MEPKDTVMSTKDIALKVCPQSSDEAGMCRIIAKAQAEITGEIMYRAGIVEVVEWLKKHGIYYHDTLYHEIEKQLKEWGIDNEST